MTPSFAPVPESKVVAFGPRRQTPAWTAAEAGPTDPQLKAQRGYRARLAAAGQAVRVVNTLLVRPALISIPGFDPATQLICDRKMFENMPEKSRNALLKLELREQDVAQLRTRNAYLEGELKLQEQYHTYILKKVITLKQQLAKRR